MKFSQNEIIVHSNKTCNQNMRPTEVDIVPYPLFPNKVESKKKHFFHIITCILTNMFFFVFNFVL
jgi:hypothetical protein